MWGDHPRTWSDRLEGSERYRMIVNYLTRMRFISSSATLDLKNTTAASSKNFRPWFQYDSKRYLDKKYYYIFGHWAALNGKTQNEHFIGLDTGCVWKGKLTAMRLEYLKKISVKY